jgi:hypothetical protein
MDTNLVVAQMQGKFKLVCFNSDVGHTMHEDSPSEAGQELFKFLKRFKVPLSREQSEEIKEKGFGVFKNGL